MYSLLLAAALAVAPRPSYPASALPPARTITGRVADSTGTALPDVRVRVLELDAARQPTPKAGSR